jgi:Flp pilus assembly protein TadB
MRAVKGRRWRIHWAWLPAAVLAIAVEWHRHGWWVAALLVLLGLALGVFLNWRARRRRRQEAG